VEFAESGREAEKGQWKNSRKNSATIITSKAFSIEKKVLMSILNCTNAGSFKSINQAFGIAMRRAME
jgi:hypothetical protein